MTMKSLYRRADYSSLLLPLVLPLVSIPSSSFVLGFNVVRQQLLLVHRRHHATTASTSASVHRRQRHVFLSSTFHDDNDDDIIESFSSKSTSPACDSSTMNRRLAFEQIGGMALSSLLLLSASTAAAVISFPANAAADDGTISDYDDTRKKRILITGSNSGIGLDAAQRMVLRGHEVVLACVSSFDIFSIVVIVLSFVLV